MTESVTPVDILFIAGEHSGDDHAAVCVKNLKDKDPNLNIYAVGGPALKRAGASLLMDLTQKSVVGLVEVLKHYRFFKNLLDWLVHWVSIYQPKVVCLVDFPGFNLRLARRLFEEKLSCKGGGRVKIYAYIAPQIWAWKRGRRFIMAKYLDQLAVIFPFEKNFFKDTSLTVRFVGHPLLDLLPSWTYDTNDTLLLLPGSRSAAVKRIFPILLTAFQFLHLKNERLRAVVVYPNESIRCILETIITKEHAQHIQLCNGKQTLKFCGALMSSGTASLGVALAGIPGVIVYKAHYLTYLLGKCFVKIPYLGMANILLKEPAYQELLQGSTLQAFKVAQAMQTFLENPKLAREQFLKYAHRLNQILSQPPDVSLDQWLLQAL